MKDCYDLRAINNMQPIEAVSLDAAISATFERRAAEIPEEVPSGLSVEFAHATQKQQQCSAYIASLEAEWLSLGRVVESLWSYLGPSCERLTSDSEK